MIRRRTLISAAAAAGTAFATGASRAQFSERNIKFTNGVNEDHPVGVGSSMSGRCRRCWPRRPAAS
jgi:TRAP-type transport system periplasmic protein